MTKYLIAGYLITWVVVIAYAASLAVRFKQCQKEKT